MAETFRLRRIILLSAKTMLQMSSQWLTYPYEDGTRGSYINIRLNNVLAGARELDLPVLHQKDSEISTIGEAPDFFPSHEISSDLLGEHCFDFGGFPKIDPRNL